MMIAAKPFCNFFNKKFCFIELDTNKDGEIIIEQPIGSAKSEWRSEYYFVKRSGIYKKEDFSYEIRNEKVYLTFEITGLNIFRNACGCGGELSLKDLKTTLFLSSKDEQDEAEKEFLDFINDKEKVAKAIKEEEKNCIKYFCDEVVRKTFQTKTEILEIIKELRRNC